MEAWVGCVAGALEAQEYRRLLEAAGFVDVEVEVAHRYDAEQIGGSGCCGSGVATTPEQVGVASALVRARKPTIL
jgi:hypothetical protein